MQELKGQKTYANCGWRSSELTTQI